MMDSTTLARKVEIAFSELSFAQEILCNISDALEKCHEDSNLTREIGVFARTLKEKDIEFFFSEALYLKNWLGDICTGIIPIKDARIHCAKLIQEVDKTLSYFNANALPKGCGSMCNYGNNCHCNSFTHMPTNSANATSEKIALSVPFLK